MYFYPKYCCLSHFSTFFKYIFFYTTAVRRHFLMIELYLTQKTTTVHHSPDASVPVLCQYCCCAAIDLVSSRVMVVSYITYRVHITNKTTNFQFFILFSSSGLDSTCWKPHIVLHLFI